MNLNKLKNYLVILFFFYSIFLKYGGGVFHILPSIVALGISFLLAVTANTKKSLVYFEYNHIFLIIGLLLVMFFGLGYTNAPNYGAKKLLLLTVQLILYLPIIPVLVKNMNLFTKLSGGFLILYIFSLFIEYDSFQKIIENTTSKSRLGGMGEDENNFHPIGISRYIGFSLIPIVLNLFKKVKPLVLVVSLFLILVSFGFLFLSATRAPILAIILVILFRIAVVKFKRTRSFFVLISLVLILTSVYSVIN